MNATIHNTIDRDVGGLGFRVAEHVMERFSEPVTVPTGGEYRVNVTADNPGRYELLIYRIARQPESAPAEIAVGQTVRGRIDHPYDIDEFKLRGTAGQEVVVFGRAVGGQAYHEFDLLNTVGRSASHFVGRDRETIEEQYSEPAKFDIDGTYTLRVNQSNAFKPSEYEFMVRRIERNVESGEAMMRAGQTLVGSLDYPHDIDELSLNAARDAEYHIAIRTLPPEGGFAQLEVVDATGRAIEYVNAMLREAGQANSTRVRLRAGTAYKLRVFGGNKPRVSYELTVTEVQ